MSHAYLFPGQGSQKRGMGADLFGEFPDLIRRASEILGYDLVELCLEDPNKLLGQTQYTQPALYVVNALSYYRRLREVGEPDYTAGHSLGEYNALLAAGVFDFETGLRLVQERGALMSRAQGGGMAAVVDLPSERIQELLREIGAENIDIANYNAPTQTAISGPKLEIERALPLLKARGARCVPLNVSAAFHSRYMAESAREFANFLSSFSFFSPKFPVIANVNARPYRADQIQSHLANQIQQSVRWTDTIRYLLAVGAEDLVEVGPGNVLTNLVKAIRRDAEPLDLSKEMSPTDSSKPTDVVESRTAATPRSDSSASRGSVPGNATVSAGSSVAPSASIRPESLGSATFRRDYGLRYAYVSGAMYKGIASKELVVRMGKAGLLGFFGTGGLKLPQVEEAIRFIQGELTPQQAYGMNLLNNLENPTFEEQTVELFLRSGVRNVEAAAYMLISEALVHFRLKGAHRDSSGKPVARNRVIGKVSRPEVAEAFMSPAPSKLLQRLVEKGKLTQEEADLAAYLPMSHDICVEADSGGHTDGGVAYVLMPAMLRLKERMMAHNGYPDPIRVGAAGGIGAPESAAAAFVLGADFILTGSVNQCTPEAGTSDLVKDLLQAINVQDTEYAPAGDMFELGAKVQVMRRGLFFPARAQKLYELYRQYDSLEAIDEKTRRTIQEKYFRRDFEEVWRETQGYYSKNNPRELEKAERNPKHKMALIFKWYFIHSNRLALKGDREQKVDFQVHCGPALGAFNQFVLGTELEDWRNRHVEIIAEKLMQGAAEVLEQRFRLFHGA